MAMSAHAQPYGKRDHVFWYDPNIQIWLPGQIEDVYNDKITVKVGVIDSNPQCSINQWVFHTITVANDRISQEIIRRFGTSRLFFSIPANIGSALRNPYFV